ncbi:hypothetical protein EYF80_054039 [Liparis tanakae]|uniref:Uncharacterized protein n=1 Tax=Liparis tanakae TaxID=230148 RepID=A0A4Z2F4Y8_9TELE|nr:hypothetical protein EYF80_054039 [Liparis tanakae]
MFDVFGLSCLLSSSSSSSSPLAGCEPPHGSEAKAAHLSRLGQIEEGPDEDAEHREHAIKSSILKVEDHGHEHHDGEVGHHGQQHHQQHAVQRPPLEGRPGAGLQGRARLLQGPDHRPEAEEHEAEEEDDDDGNDLHNGDHIPH